MNEVPDRDSIKPTAADGGTSSAVALDALLRATSPPARVLGIGSAAASMTALLAQLGFTAAAWQLGEWSSKLVGERFNVTQLADDMETLRGHSGLFDVAVVDLAVLRSEGSNSVLADLLPKLQSDALVLGIVREDEGVSAATCGLDAFALELENSSFEAVRQGAAPRQGWILLRRGAREPAALALGSLETSRIATAFLRLYFEAEQLAKAGATSVAAIKSLESQTVAQARELAVLRWEILSIMRSRPLVEHVMKLRHLVGRRIPRQLRPRQIRNALSVARRRLKALAPASSSRPQTELELALQLGSPILIADSSAAAQQIAESIDPKRVINLTPGAGFPNSLPLATENEPPLRSAAPGSLAQWLIDNDGRLTSAGSVMVNAADELSLNLLRGRLRRGQRLVLTSTEGTPSLLVGELGQASEQLAKLSCHANPPDTWLDPLDERGHVDTRVASRAWPKISVVMVSFNQAAFLEEGLRSVLDQGYPNLEVLVVDAKSKDGSIDILERYRSRLDFLLIEPDRGQSDGLNKGFARATGDILTWVNSDDLLEPGALFRVAQAFMLNKVDMVAGGCRQIGLTRAEIIRNHHTKLPLGVPVSLPLGLLLELDRFWLAACFFYQPEVFFTRDIWQRSGAALRTDLYYVLDYDLWVRMAAAGATILHIPDYLACSRTHEQQKTTLGMPYMPEVQRLLREYSSRLIPRH